MAGDRRPGRTLDRATLEARVRALELPAKGWALFGSAPLLLHGLVPAVADIDIVARGAAWERLRSRVDATETRASVDRRLRLPGEVEVFDGWFGWNADALIARAEVVGGLRSARLEDVLAFKRWLDRPKDRADIARLEAHLRRGSGPPAGAAR